MTAARKRNSPKRKPSSAGASGQRVTRSPRAIATALLKASRDDTRKQDLRKNPPKDHPNGSMPFSSLEVVGLLNRRTKAFLELPTRIARCHSPFEVWSEQARFMQQGFTDYAHHVMTNILYGLQRTTRP